MALFHHLIRRTPLATRCATFTSSNMRHKGCCAFAILALQSDLAGARPASHPAFVNQQRSLFSQSARASAAKLNMAAPTSISFGPGRPDEVETSATVLVGKKSFLEQIGKDPSSLAGAVGFDVDPALFSAALESIDGPSGSVSTFVSGPKKPQQLSLCALPDKVSRNNHPMSVHTISDLVAKACPGKGNVHVVVGGVSGDAPAGPLALAVAKSFPSYSRKTKDGVPVSEGDEREVRVSFVDDKGADAAVNGEALLACKVAADAVRIAGRLVDTPPEELTTTAFSEYCRSAVDELGTDRVTVREIVGEELNEKGYGGLYGVGKAADCPPRLVIMTYDPPGEPTDTIALVGKGIVYDTGGLSLKSKDGMCGMKGDMGGAAGTFGGFFAAIQMNPTQKIHLILCLAENAIGPGAFRNDDILSMYSGKTVEVNNCDAEGRLVLGDGVAHATKHFDGLNLVLDMATLTGAQLIATGKKHAGVLANTVELERKAVDAGLRSGDLCFPLLYAPELLKSEFKSQVADMKNSVKDRMNAQTSCAGHFIEDHLAADYEGGWLHVDMAGPAEKEERGTGYGVGLILSLLGTPGF